LVAGVSFSMMPRQEKVYSGQCDILWGEIPSLPNGQAWQYNSSELSPGFSQNNLLLVVGDVVTGECRGQYDIVLEHPILKNSVFAPTTPGTIPNLVVGRLFVPLDADADANCVACADSFVAMLATK
jgi:hypothetical protein